VFSPGRRVLQIEELHRERRWRGGTYTLSLLTDLTGPTAAGCRRFGGRCWSLISMFGQRGSERRSMTSRGLFANTMTLTASSTSNSWLP
jgi:hypothetical protein